MKHFVIIGYALSAALYLAAWWNPAFGAKNGLIQWVSFSRLALAEFLSLHAATLLGAIVLAGKLEPNSAELGPIFWVMLAAYGAFALMGYLFHRSHRALFALYLLLAIRCAQFLSVGSLEPDVMRAEVVKNFVMSAAMMLLVAGIAMGDDGFTPWQDAFARTTTWWGRVWKGRPLLFAAAYYALWAFVEWKWPERMSQ
jgi:hypothetical protein